MVCFQHFTFFVYLLLSKIVIAFSPWLCVIAKRMYASVHYGVEKSQVAQVFCVKEIGKIQLDKTTIKFFFGLKCHLIGFNSLDKIQLSLSYLGNSWDKLTSQVIRNCKISFKLSQAVFQQPPWFQDSPLHLLKPSGFTHSHSHQSN